MTLLVNGIANEPELPGSWAATMNCSLRTSYQYPLACCSPGSGLCDLPGLESQDSGMDRLRRRRALL